MNPGTPQGQGDASPRRRPQPETGGGRIAAAYRPGLPLTRTTQASRLDLTA
jgi:hypothetical protein